MITRLNHVMIAVRNLEAAIQHYQRLGFHVTPGGSHAALGTHNVMIHFGLPYFELVAPFDPVQTMTAIPGSKIVLDILDQRDGAVVGFALTSTDIQHELEMLRGTNLVVTPPYPLQRVQEGKEPVNVQVFMPGGFPWRRPWPFLYQWELSDEQHISLLDTQKHQNGVNDLVRVSVAVNDLPATLALYQQRFGLRLYHQDRLKRLHARRATFRLGPVLLDLLSPLGSGPLKEDLEVLGEGVFEVVLSTDRIQQTRSYFDHHDVQYMNDVVGPGSLLISPDETFTTRCLIVQTS